MASIREVVQTLRDRDGVDAVVLLGKDGLTIDAATSEAVDADGLAAIVPSIIISCNQLGDSSGQGAFGRSVIEYGGGKVLVAEINEDALLAVFVDGDTNVGSLLFELEQHQPAIAQLL